LANCKEIILTLPPTSPFERCLGTDLYALSSNLANGLFRNYLVLANQALTVNSSYHMIVESHRAVYAQV